METMFELDNMETITERIIGNRLFSLTINEDMQCFQFIYSRLSDGVIIGSISFPFFQTKEDDEDLMEVKKALVEREAYNYYQKRMLAYK